MMTGMSRPLARSSRQTSQPLMPGIMMSRRTRSGASDRASARPRRPSVADSVWYPSKRRLSSSPRTISGSSSTIRILGTSSLRSCGHRHVQREAAALARTALDLHAPAVRLRDVLDERQAHPAAPAALRLTPSDAIELLEDSLGLARRNADALVGDLDGHPVALDPDRDRNMSALARVLDGIVHEIGDRLLDRLGIHERFGQIGRHRHVRSEE